MRNTILSSIFIAILFVSQIILSIGADAQNCSLKNPQTGLNLTLDDVKIACFYQNSKLGQIDALKQKGKSCQEASFKGDLKQYIIDHYSYPSIINDKIYDGLLGVSILVDANGKVTSVECGKSDEQKNPELTQSIKECFMSMPIWKPAIYNDKPEASRNHITLKFGTMLLNPYLNQETGEINQNGMSPEDKKNLAKAYYTYATSTQQENNRTSELFAIAANLGSGEALFFVADSIGRINGDSLTAISYFKIALAKLQRTKPYTIDGSLILSHMYRYGLGVKKNNVVADTWLKMYASKGEPCSFALSHVLNCYPLEQDDSEIYKKTDKMPTFRGGEDGLYAYIGDHLIYPKAVKERDISGVLYTKFVVEKDGRVSNVKMKQKLHKLVDTEVMRVVSSLPRFAPGIKDGQPVRVEQVIHLISAPSIQGSVIRYQ